jgi:hypothetical protein
MTYRTLNEQQWSHNDHRADGGYIGYVSHAVIFLINFVVQKQGNLVYPIQTAIRCHNLSKETNLITSDW